MADEIFLIQQALLRIGEVPPSTGISPRVKVGRELLFRAHKDLLLKHDWMFTLFRNFTLTKVDIDIDPPYNNFVAYQLPEDFRSILSIHPIRDFIVDIRNRCLWSTDKSGEISYYRFPKIEEILPSGYESSLISYLAILLDRGIHQSGEKRQEMTAFFQEDLSQAIKEDNYLVPQKDLEAFSPYGLGSN